MKIRILFLFVIFLIIFNNKNVKSNDDPFFQENTYIVVGDNVNVRTEPKTSAKIIMQLKITNLVKLLKRSNIKYRSNEIEGEWVYVDTLRIKNNKTYETYKGWILDYYLANGKQFEKVNEFYDCTLEGYVGDYHVYYEFRKDGTYKHIYYNPLNNKIDQSIGRIYRYRNVILTKDLGVQRFYIENNIICCADSEVCTTIK
jgi:predicted SnoaL-like aldol condensation-catalyzing enzyme